MKKTYTPGPWKVRKHWSDEGAYEIYPTRGKKPSFGEWASIAEVTGDVSKSESAMQNARLIAAAPELLEACQTFAEWLKREDDGFDHKTYERQTPEGEAAWREWFDGNIALCSLAQEQVKAAIAKATGQTP